MRKILILIASPGAGHRIAGISLSDLIEEYLNEKPFMYDALKNSYFPYSKAHKIYEFLSKHPKIWKFLYYFSDGSKYEKFLKIQNFLMYSSVKKIIDEINPQIVFCTHPFYIPVLKDLKGTKKLRVISVMTDFGEVHKAWICEGFDILWIPSQITFNEIKNKFGIRDGFKILGYPVRKGFWRIKSSEKKYILIMGGGRGAGPIKKIFELISDIKINQIYVCGTNEKLKNGLLNIKKRKKLDHIKIIGFTDRIYELISESICVITKPGGSTVAECNFLERPIVAIEPLPGQEEGNAKFIEQADSGIVVYNLSNLKDTIKKIINGEIDFSFKEKLKNYFESQKKFLKELII